MAMLAFLRRAAQCSPLTTHARKDAMQARRLASSSMPSQQTLSVASLFSSQTRTRATQQQPYKKVEYLANDVTGVLASVAIVGALVGVGKMWWDASSPSSPSTSSPSPRAGSAAKKLAIQPITRDDIALFFVDLKAAVQQLYAQLPQLDESFRQHLKSQKLELGEEEYKQTFLQQLFDVLQNIEQQVVGSRGWDRDSFQHAMDKYAEDDEIVAHQKELEQIMHSIFPPPEIPAHLTPEKLLEMVTVLTKGMGVAMTEMLQHARAEGITDPAKAMEEFQQIYLDQVEQLTFEEMKKNDVSNEIFNVALQKCYSENAAFRKQVEQVYEQQAEEFRRMGLDVGGN